MSTPSLILISGPPGVGKSTLSINIAKEVNAIVLDKDCIDAPFSPGDRGQNYTDNIEPKVLQALINLAKLNLSLGHQVILDVPWSHILLNTPKLVETLQSIGSKIIAIELVLDENEHKRRIRNRNLQRDHVKLTDDGWENFKKTDRIDEKIPIPHHELDASLDRSRLASEAILILKKQLKLS